jgi:PhnB protein
MTGYPPWHTKINCQLCTITQNAKLMSSVAIYLNFQGNTEEAFNYYKSAFKTEFSAPISRMKDVPQQPGMPPLPEKEKNAVMHVALPILGGTQIMGTDMLESMGHKLRIGNNTTICLEPDSKEETDRLFAALSAGGSDIMAPQEMFWGAYWGTCQDKFGIRWMFNFQKRN